MQDELEHIDESVWLPKGEAVYTQARLSKGDLRIDKDGQARFSPDNVMTVLRDFDVLNDEHIQAARRFGIWRTMLGVALGVDRITKTMKGEAGKERQEDSYVQLVQTMQPITLRIVTEACDRPGYSLANRLRVLKAKDGIRYSAALRSLRNTYRDAFDDLKKAVDAIDCA